MLCQGPELLDSAVHPPRTTQVDVANRRKYAPSTFEGVKPEKLQA